MFFQKKLSYETYCYNIVAYAYTWIKGAFVGHLLMPTSHYIVRPENNRRHRWQLASMPLSVALVPLKLATYFAILNMWLPWCPKLAYLNLPWNDSALTCTIPYFQTWNSAGHFILAIKMWILHQLCVIFYASCTWKVCT